MAIAEYQYQDATPEQLTDCIRWCQEKLALSDWDISLLTTNDPPKGEPSWRDCGQCWTRAGHLLAIIWLPLERLKNLNTNPFETCIHEMLHILATGRIDIEDGDEQDILCYTIAGLIYRVFCQDKRLEIAPLYTEIDAKYYEG